MTEEISAEEISAFKNPLPEVAQEIADDFIRDFNTLPSYGNQFWEFCQSHPDLFLDRIRNPISYRVKLEMSQDKRERLQEIVDRFPESPIINEESLVRSLEDNVKSLVKEAIGA